jgi:hypothetical protein
VNGGFCCDQRTIYVPGWNLTAWTLLYSPDAANNNVIRLAIAQGSGGLEANTWSYWDFSAADASLGTGVALDYPQIAYSSNDLYFTANAVFSDDSIDASVIFRCPLSELVAPGGGTLTCTNYWLTGADTFTPAQGTTSTMYWADHVDNATLRVFSWPESVDWEQVTAANVTHSAFVDSNYSCPSPDQTDMCQADDWTMRDGWYYNGTIGFAWDAAQGSGGLGIFPYPYVHVVEINQSTMGLVDEPAIWSTNMAWAYAAVAVNGDGVVGGSATYGGGGYYPGFGVLSDKGGTSGWQSLSVIASTSGPPANRWGDFQTIRPYSGNGSSWVAAGYTIQGNCTQNWGPCAAVQPQFAWFGLPGSVPCPSSSSQLRTSSAVHRDSLTSAHVVYLPLVANDGCVG